MSGGFPPDPQLTGNALRKRVSSIYFVLVLLLLGTAFETRGQSLLPTPQRWSEAMEQRNCPIKLEKRVAKHENGQVSAWIEMKITGTRAVRGYVIYYHGSTRNDVETNINPLDGFRPGTISQVAYWKNVDEGEKVVVSIDHILFTDGTSWGPDSLRRAGRIEEYLEGRKAAIDNLTMLLYGIVQNEYVEAFNVVDSIREPFGDHEPTKPGISFMEKGYERVVNSIAGRTELKEVIVKLRAMEKHPSP